MEPTLDDTTLATLSLLEGRLLRIEHLLYGHVVPQPTTSAIRSLHDLERRFSKLLQHIRVYGELLKLYKSNPSLFQPTPASQPPPELSMEALRAIILSAASSYPATASALTAISDTPIPDPIHSSTLAALLPRMKGIEATQLAQDAEITELRARSEAAVRQWYKRDLMGYSDFVASVEGRIERVERGVRRAEKARGEI
ncbi:putative nuclear distribution protein [Rosellinia necatrix]|uniref:Putative nuclear distribution protein n=1 Tax=Rosellinia necatrix TaxID=77044 RepID=A0A1W2TGH3_ROSNE|nr:putative nuclear distribution protein [Rosellinia necatrix]